MNWKWIPIGFIIVAVLALSLLAKPVQVGLRTAALLIDLGISYQWKTSAIPRSILISEIAYPCDNRTITANLYCPNDQRRHPAIIMGHGAFAEGKDDWGMRLVGESLARAGYVALIPNLENLAGLRLHQDDVEALITTFDYLSRQKFANGKIGMLGFCLSAPLILLAAEELSATQDIAVISSWGGYYNIEDWIQAVITGHCTYQGETKPWKANPTLVREVCHWLTELLPNSSDTVSIKQMLEGSTDSTNGNLSPSGQALYELLANRDPERADALWARLDPQTQRSLASLSPSIRINELQTKMAIVHAVADPYIPSVESYKLADAIEDDDRVYLGIFRQFSHVDPNKLLKIKLSNLYNIIFEVARFYLYIYHILYQL